jgi:hypothetical protein
MVDIKKAVREAEVGFINFLKVLKEDPIYGGRLKVLKTKEMGFERAKFQLILELGRTAYRLYYKNKITQPELRALCKKLQDIDTKSKIYHGTERRLKQR